MPPCHAYYHSKWELILQGRFFAANEIKMILSYALNNYDIKLPEGVTERYPNVTFGTSVCFLFLPLYLRALTVA
jgi:hypothetical protein